MCFTGFVALTNEQKRANAVSEAMDSVVEIEVMGTGNALGFELKEASGTGFYISPNEILTVAHVPLQAGVTEIKIKRYEGEDYYPSTTCKATAGARDEKLDLMVLDVDCVGTPLKLTDGVQVGQDVFMLGNLPTMSHIVTGGIVSRIIDMAQGEKTIVANVDGGAGNSGSPLVNSKGEVIGIVDALHKDYAYLKFAVPSETIKEFINRG